MVQMLEWELIIFRMDGDIMSIKPVDFQISVPRTLEVSKAKEDENHKGQTQQQNQVGALQTQAETSIRQVQKRSQAEAAGLRGKQERDREKSKKQQAGNSHTQKKDDNAKNETVETGKTSFIDVKI